MRVLLYDSGDENLHYSTVSDEKLLLQTTATINTEASFNQYYKKWETKEVVDISFKTGTCFQFKYTFYADGIEVRTNK